MGGVEGRDPSSSLLGPWAGARDSVESAASHWELGWSLALHASSSSCLAPRTWPVGAEARFSADRVIFSEHFKHPYYLVLYHNNYVTGDKGRLLRCLQRDTRL